MSRGSYDVAVLPGDGIGPEVVAEAEKVLNETSRLENFSLNFQKALIGGAAIDAVGVPLPDETLKLCLASGAVLLGSVGGPRWDSLPPERRPEVGGLLTLRKALKLFANLRPVKLYPQLVAHCPLDFKDCPPEVDILTVRELAGGVYFGEPKSLSDGMGLDTMVYRKHEVLRIAEVAFEAARRRKRRLCSVDKANVLRSSMLWRKVVSGMAAGYEDVEFSSLYVDNAAMQLILRPERFDVIVTGNLFGDILSDETAALAGSLGLLPSASLGESVHIFEPSGGSAPDIAGRGEANPLAQILSGAMMLEHSFGEMKAAMRIHRAVDRVIADGLRTGDIASGGGNVVGSAAMGDAVAEAL